VPGGGSGGTAGPPERGPSLTEGRPVSGAIPPLSDAAWQQAFARYQQIPEYQQLNRGMTLDEFKGIYWWEYVHRLWGRLIGLAFALPFAIFLLRRRVRRAPVP